MLYSSVGHGGATAYLAILVLAGYFLAEVRTPVLILNVLVASIAFALFTRAGHLRRHLLWPFLLTSVPAAYLGASITLTGTAEGLVLGTALGAAALRLLLIPTAPRPRFWVSRRTFLVAALVLGALLGFLAGATGIGGGIFLSPLLVFLGWATVKEAGTVASGFIVLNSLSGLARRLPVESPDWGFTGTLALLVLVGGTLGAFFGAYRVPPVWSRRLLGGVLTVASVRAFLNAFGS